MPGGCQLPFDKLFLKPSFRTIAENDRTSGEGWSALRRRMPGVRIGVGLSIGIALSARPGGTTPPETMVAMSMCTPGTSLAKWARNSAADDAPADPAGELPLQDYLDRMERAAIEDALRKTRYNRTAAARLLGVTFRSLRYRLQRLGITD